MIILVTSVLLVPCIFLVSLLFVVSVAPVYIELYLPWLTLYYAYLGSMLEVHNIVYSYLCCPCIMLTLLS